MYQLINTINKINITFVINRFDVKKEMKRNFFPDYIIESFIMSGYDNHLALLDMDVSEHQGNSIQVIEEYIDDNKFENCMSSVHHKNKQYPFKFPPGHKLLIRKFVRDMKERWGEKKRKNSSDNKKTTAKRRKTYTRRPVNISDKDLQDGKGEDSDENVSIVTQEIRSKICSWVKLSFKKKINENEHFTILTTKTTNKKISVQIRCGCGKLFTLQRKSEGCKPWLLSNWT